MLKRILRLTKGSGWLFVGAMVATALATLCSFISPLIVKITVDSVINGEPMSAPAVVINFIESLGGVSALAKNLWLCAIGLVVIALVSGLLSYLNGKWLAEASENIAKGLKDRLYDHLQKLPYDYHVKAQTGDLIQRCTSDVETIRRFLSGQLIEVVRTVLMVVISLTVMWQLNWSLTLYAVIVVPFIFLFSLIFMKKITRSFLLVDEKEGELSTVLQENLSGVRVVRAFGRQRFEIDKFEERNSSFSKLNFRLIKLMALFWALSDALCLIQIALVLVLGVRLVVLGEMSLGTLLVFNTYEGMMIWPIRHLGRVLSDMGKMEVSLNRVYEVLHTPKEEDTPGAIRHSLTGDIVFDGVSFEYEKDKPVLRDLSFTVKAGETIAILGATGSGKSTLMHILLRLYDYKAGSVKINGEELRNISKHWLREKVGIVLQEPFLYSKTIRENLRMAGDVSDADIYHSAQVAAVHDVILEFEKGYETMVGERGVTLSGGQKQRVAIARTLIKQSSILIFDDSLSAVDTHTDAEIRAALRQRSKDVTTFIISQRITTLMEADRIFVIEHGRLADSGTHEELVNRGGLYSRIWQLQSLTEAEEGEDE